MKLLFQNNKKNESQFWLSTPQENQIQVKVTLKAQLCSLRGNTHGCAPRGLFTAWRIHYAE